MTLPTSTGTDLQYEVRVEYVDATRQRQTWRSGWFDLTAAADLADKALDSSLNMTPSLASTLDARIDALEADSGVGDALAELDDQVNGVQDHGNVSGALTVDPSNGFHVFDATGPTEITLGPPPGNSVAFKAITGADDVTVDGLDDFSLSDNAWATFVYVRGAWDLASAGASGGGTVEPVTDPPTQPGTVTVTPTADGYNLSWVASTVAAGYEVQIDGGAWVDSGTGTTHTYTGLLSSSTHSGNVRAYNSLGAKSTARAWGPADVNSLGLHEQLLAYDAPVYLNFTNGSLEDFSSVAGHVWNPDFFEWAGAEPVTFDGPVISGIGTTSAHFPDKATIRGLGDFSAFANQPSISIVALFAAGTRGPIQLGTLGGASANTGTLGNEVLSDTPYEHLIVWTWEEGVGGKVYRDENLTTYPGFNWTNGPLDTGDAKGVWIRSGNFSFSQASGTSDIGLVLMLPNYVMSLAEVQALATAAGTYGNPR